MENPKKQNVKAESLKAAAKTTPTAPAAPIKVPPMFRPIDWFALLIAFFSVWAVYLWTLAPEQTLEDSGELCTGSFYAGIPHPPGYAFWSIYSWIWTVIVPFGNVAWRVEVGQSFASAMGCGLLALMVSRGGSMIIEGIEELKSVDRRWENAICIVSGIVAGMLLGFGGFMWKESVVVNRISIFGVPWLLALLSLIMRWMYAPHQRWYLYFAMLLYGWIATIHQSLILSAVGVEILITLILPRLGRDMFAVNSLCYFLILFFKAKGSVPALNAMTNTEQLIFHIVGIGSLATVSWLFVKTNKIFTEWRSIIMCGLMWGFGVSVYLYSAVSCMTVPPMQWAYPRTVEGFFHMISRGQYGTGEGVNLFADPSRFFYQMYYLAEGLSQSFSWVYMFIGLLPFLFLWKMKSRERGWLLGITAIYLTLSVQLVMVLNVTADRSTSDLNKVFFTASHGLFGILIGYGFVILAAYIATHYKNFRRTGLLGGGVAALLAAYTLVESIGKLYFGKAGQLQVSWLPFPKWGGWEYLAFGPNGQFGLSEIPHSIMRAFTADQYGVPVFAGLILLAIPVVFVLALLAYRKRGPVFIVLLLFCAAPVWSGMTHWYKCEQRNHWFGYWFGHDMFTPPYLAADGQLTYDNVKRTELLKDAGQMPYLQP